MNVALFGSFPKCLGLCDGCGYSYSMLRLRLLSVTDVSYLTTQKPFKYKSQVQEEAKEAQEKGRGRRREEGRKEGRDRTQSG